MILCSFLFRNYLDSLIRRYTEFRTQVWQPLIPYANAAAIHSAYWCSARSFRTQMRRPFILHAGAAAIHSAYWCSSRSFRILVRRPFIPHTGAAAIRPEMNGLVFHIFSFMASLVPAQV